MKIPLHVKIRKNFRSLLQNILSKLVPNRHIQHFIDKNKIKNILIIRPNYRIGNIILLTPLLNELYKQVPNAKIDIIVGIKLAGQVLEPLPNVDKVFSIPRKLLLQPINMYNFIKGARAKRYDLAINISSGSISSQLVTLLANSKYKTSFYNDKNWSPLTHVITKEGLYTHAGLQPLEYLKLFNVALPQQGLHLDIKLTKNELEIGVKDLHELLTPLKKSKEIKTIALFRNARFDKKIPDNWWKKWYKELIKLNKNIVVIDILSPDILIKLDDNFLEYSNKNLRILGAFFKACDIYISADTGPMHLASASQAKTIALFNKTNIKTYGTLGIKDKTIDIEKLTPENTAQLTYEHITL